MPNFHMGHNVLARDYRNRQRWRHGTIHACSGSHTYEVKVAPGVSWKRHSNHIVHTSVCPGLSKTTVSETITTPEPSIDVSLLETSKKSERDKIPTR
ncbi:hypothetical protein PoB_001983700 [Plakobranchus ocellatus]|uniref:Uncharacterized protein n=1 Tax=Plakobranchus ocellatus TaxID=259542 RepID=A0AAV3ZDH2_9GAST|nr:hypothetical protein PoB_001983700 [Plakobranchus ocellatus]